MIQNNFIKSLFSTWKNISISSKLYIVVGTMALLVIIELLTLSFAMENLSAVRAFISSEAIWSKSQKNAVYRFQRYTMTNNEAEYQAFQESLKIPEGDRIARLELEKANPNLEIVRQGFLEGKIHQDDIPAVIKLLRRFYWLSYVSKALEVWEEGDRLVLELRQVASEYHLKVEKNMDTLRATQEALDKVTIINDKLTVVEGIFSSVLGEGSRWMENMVVVILFFLVITVETIGLTLTFLTSKAISKGLFDLNELSTEFAKGDFSRRLEVTSGDELGGLTQSVNKMGDILQKSYNDLLLSHKDLEEKIQARTRELADIANQNRELYIQAKDAIKMRDDFLAIASHELRTPLTALNLQLYLLERAASTENKETDLNNIKTLVRKSGGMVKKVAALQVALMDLAQIRTGKIEIKKENNDLRGIGIECISQLSSDTMRTGAEIILEDGDPVHGLFDVIRVAQVVTNLLTNAIKYGEKKPVNIKIFQEKNYGVIEVRDQGPGISIDKQQQIFERFERASEDPAVSGLGLGLYISKQIMEAHNGTITIKSTPGQGSTFMVKFPLS